MTQTSCMNFFLRFFTSAFALFILGWLPLHAQSLPGGLRGNVQEMGSQMPLEYALVAVDVAQPGLTTPLSAYTNSDGYFQINGILLGPTKSPSNWPATGR